MADLLLEILSEEIPARMQARAADDLRRMVTDRLKEAGLAFGEAQSFVTPRRLALAIASMPTATPDIAEERRGPRVGAPPAALDGFFKSAGVTEQQCEQRDTGKGVFWFAIINKPGRATADLLKDAIESTLAAFPWPKAMRWADYKVRWVRPIRSILCLFAGSVVPVSFGPISAGDSTEGHPIRNPGRFAVTDVAHYRERLRGARVILDRAERQAEIKSLSENEAARRGVSILADDGLLEEVTGLVEYPVPLIGVIDQRFMDLPAEVLSTAMRTHQKYFSLIGVDGKLAPHFLTIANNWAGDDGAAIIAGNERVLRARLSDARFFWDQDRKTKLEARLPKLSERVFFAGLGTLADKVTRIERLARHLATLLPGLSLDLDQVERAARLAKADLATEMVGEFPELQGIMGHHYALAEGESAAVAQAIMDHYQPAGAVGTLPRNPIGTVLSLADKLDTLVGFFGIGEKPTGSRDPFALRRAALGTIRLLLETGLNLNLRPILEEARIGYDLQGVAIQPSGLAELLDFFDDRLEVHLRDSGVRHDLIKAVLAQPEGAQLQREDDLVRLVARVRALEAFLAGEDGANLLVAYRRAANIVRIEGKKDGKSYDEAADPAALGALEAVALFEALGAAHEPARHARVAGDFAAAMAELARLRGPIDLFFDKVTVNDENPDRREHRLRLLGQIKGVMNLVADFSKIEG